MKKRFLAMIMALVLSFAIALPSTAFAAEYTPADEVPSVTITCDQAAEMLGIPVEEMHNYTFYVLEADGGNSTNSLLAIQVPDNGSPVTVDSMAVSGGTTTGADFQVAGDRLLWAMSVLNMSNKYVDVSATLYARGAGAQKTLNAADGETVDSGFMNCTRNTTFYIQYTVPSGVSGYVLSVVAATNS